MAAKRRKKPEDRLDEFLAAEQRKLQLQRCRVCANEDVRAIVSAHLDKIFEGETTITLAHVHRNLLVELGGPKSYEAVKRHVKQCLNRNVQTGEALNG